MRTVRLTARSTAKSRDAMKISSGLLSGRRMTELRQWSGNRVTEQKSRSDSVCWSSLSFSWDLLYLWMTFMIIAPVMRANRMINEKKVLIRILFRLRFEDSEEGGGGCCCCCCWWWWFWMRLSLPVVWKLSMAGEFGTWGIGNWELGSGSFNLVFLGLRLQSSVVGV